MGDWSIVLGERPLNTNAAVKLFLGPNDSHSFIQVRDDQKKPLLELHGLYTSGWGAAFNTCAKTFFGTPIHSSHLHVIALTSNRLMKIFTGHKPVTTINELEGSKEKILRCLESMVRAADRINKDDMDYFIGLRGSKDGGQTCHSVSTELFRAAGVDVCNEKIAFDTPGRDTNLEALDPALCAIRFDAERPIEAIKASIVEKVSRFSPDLKTIPSWLQPEPAYLPVPSPALATAQAG